MCWWLTKPVNLKRSTLLTMLSPIISTFSFCFTFPAWILFFDFNLSNLGKILFSWSSFIFDFEYCYTYLYLPWFSVTSWSAFCFDYIWTFSIVLFALSSNYQCSCVANLSYLLKKELIIPFLHNICSWRDSTCFSWIAFLACWWHYFWL